MQKKTTQARLVLLAGITGILGTLLTIISDFVLLGRPISAYSFFKLGPEIMAGISQWRITTGTFCGIFVLPLQIAGLITVYYGLKTSGKLIPLIIVITNLHALIMAVAFHMSYAFIGSGWKFYYKIGVGNIVATEMIKKFDYYWKIAIFIIFVEILFSSILYVFIILKGNTLYPKWMSLLNPIFILLLMYLLIALIPSPIGGFIAPAYLNISTLVFFLLSTIIIYKRLD